MDNTIKIQKYLALCGLMSRRSAEEEISSGNVAVNGAPAEIGQRIDPRRDRIEYKGRVVKPRRAAHKTYIMLNKPRGYVTTMKDEKGRKSVNMLVSADGKRVYPVGRLDMDSEGLLLMTDDGDFANAMTHPSHHVAKKYEVTLKGCIGRADIAALSSIDEIDGLPIMPVACELIEKGEEKSVVGVTLFEGRNRQIRKMCEKCSLVVKRLKRVSVGSLSLDVPVGKWRYLTKKEVDSLKSGLSDGAEHFKASERDGVKGGRGRMGKPGGRTSEAKGRMDKPGDRTSEAKGRIGKKGSGSSGEPRSMPRRGGSSSSRGFPAPKGKATAEGDEKVHTRKNVFSIRKTTEG